MLLFQSIDDAIDVRKDNLFLATEVQVDGALADSRLGGNVLNGHFAVAKPGEETVSGVKDRLPDSFFRCNCGHFSLLD